MSMDFQVRSWCQLISINSFSVASLLRTAGLTVCCLPFSIGSIGFVLGEIGCYTISVVYAVFYMSFCSYIWSALTNSRSFWLAFNWETRVKYLFCGM